ncbi:CDP-alcohol phosphatidyltransferase family protein [Candidatus Woesearchaeota archaeon]|nr:CDP-alcohol phosphatidyltransferase family protein [Candidatus Woesearchaeota archaeon]
MQWAEFRKLPNQVTLLRLLCIPVLWILAFLHLKTPFGLVFAFAAITDWFDGHIARKLNQASDFGHWFDSFVDNIIALSLFPWLWALANEFVRAHMIVLGIVLGLFITSIIMGFIRYGTMVDYHLYSNKLAAVFVNVFVVHATLFSPSPVLFYVTAVIAVLSIAEEILITLTNRSKATHKYSLFERR